MRAADLTTALILIAGGVLVVWDSVRLGIGWGTDGPKSGFFPFWLAVVMMVSCVGIIFQSMRRTDRRPFVARQAMVSVLTVLLPATGFVVATQFLGLYVASALFMASYMRWIGRYSWIAAAALSIAFPLITFYVFEIWFLVPMPKGPLEGWLGY